MAKSKKELIEENEVLTRALRDHDPLAFRNLEAPVMIPVKNFSSSFVVYPYEYKGQNKRLELDISGRKSMGAVPSEVWDDLERNTVLVDQGYIARTDQPITNPNVIEDVAKLVENLSEQEFKDRISQITNPNSLYKLVAYVEPIKDKDGKLLSVQKVVRERVYELTKTRIVDEED